MAPKPKPRWAGRATIDVEIEVAAEDLMEAVERLDSAAGKLARRLPRSFTGNQFVPGNARASVTRVRVASLVRRVTKR